MARKLRGVQIPARGKCRVTGSAGSWVSIADVKECAKVCSSHWFDPSTLRFFKSRVSGDAYADGNGGAYFTSSEQPPHGPRMHSVRYFNPKKCNMDTIGEFLGYRTAAAAKRAAKKFASGG